MWFKDKKQPPIRTLVGDQTVIHGDLRFVDGLRIDGEVHGDVVASGDGPSILVISHNARVHGKVKAGHVIISGTLVGELQSDQLLEIQPQARIYGDVRYDTLEMHSGATVEGELQSLKSDHAPVLKLAASKSG
jgi:cytoskeletal protein CcmA (bactofilin family)